VFGSINRSSLFYSDYHDCTRINNVDKINTPYYLDINNSIYTIATAAPGNTHTLHVRAQEDDTGGCVNSQDDDPYGSTNLALSQLGVFRGTTLNGGPGEISVRIEVITR
jgi:hypothetical protein